MYTMSTDRSGSHGDVADAVKVDDTIRVRRPSKVKVLLLNDDYTTMEFVVYVLETIFHKLPAEAVQIMMKVHNEGRGLCGYYSFQVAEAKVATVHAEARSQGFPLRCVIE